MIRKLKYCPNCLGCNSGTKNVIVDPNDFFTKGKTIRETYYYTNYKGFYTTFTYLDNTTCPRCKAKLIEMNLTEDEWHTLHAISLEQDFVFAMDKLKQNDIIEFTAKMSQFKKAHSEWLSKQIHKSDTSQSNVPKCPTCGSTNIKKISGTKRWVGTGLFGLASSDLGKTMQCNSCGYKW